jgi:hypothetical protein
MNNMTPYSAPSSAEPQTAKDRLTKCPKCKQWFERPLGWEPDYLDTVCVSCRPFYSDTLLKIVGDYFDGVLGLKNGMVIRFRTGRIDGDFVHLTLDGMPQIQPLPYGFDRGIDVRLSEIVWCADTPNGS